MSANDMSDREQSLKDFLIKLDGGEIGVVHIFENNAAKPGVKMRSKRAPKCALD